MVVIWLRTSSGSASQATWRVSLLTAGRSKRERENWCFRENFMKRPWSDFCSSGGTPRLCWGRIPVRACQQIQVALKRGSQARGDTPCFCLSQLCGAPTPTSIYSSLSGSEGKSDLKTEMSANERATRTLREILQNPGNDACGDCGAAGKTINVLIIINNLELLRCEVGGAEYYCLWQQEYYCLWQHAKVKAYQCTYLLTTAAHKVSYFMILDF